MVQRKSRKHTENKHKHSRLRTDSTSSVFQQSSDKIHSETAAGVGMYQFAEGS